MPICVCMTHPTALLPLRAPPGMRTEAQSSRWQLYASANSPHLCWTICFTPVLTLKISPRDRRLRRCQCSATRERKDV